VSQKTNESRKHPVPGAEPGSVASESRQDRILVPGLAAGVLGGLAMAAWMMASAAYEGLEPLAPLLPFGETFAGSEPRGPGYGNLLLGLAFHFAMSAFVGVLFTAILPRTFPPGSAAVVCVGFTFVVMAFMSSLILPAVNPALREDMPRLGGSWVLAHAAYGATVGVAAQRLRQRRRREQRVPEQEREARPPRDAVEAPARAARGRRPRGDPSGRQEPGCDG
jgi:hypothetical protein